MVRKKFQISTGCESLKVQMFPNQYVFDQQLYKKRKSSYVHYHHVFQFIFLVIILSLIGFFAWKRGNFLIFTQFIQINIFILDVNIIQHKTRNESSINVLINTDSEDLALKIFSKSSNKSRIIYLEILEIKPINNIISKNALVVK